MLSRSVIELCVLVVVVFIKSVESGCGILLVKPCRNFLERIRTCLTFFQTKIFGVTAVFICAPCYQNQGNENRMFVELHIGLIFCFCHLVCQATLRNLKQWDSAMPPHNALPHCTYR